MGYRVFETEQFQRDLTALGPAARERLERKLREHVYPSLREGPYVGPNVRRLQGYAPPTWRYRVGDWRFFYTIDEGAKVVLMLVADHRGRAYR